MAQINKPTDYFNTKLYSGNSSTQSITGINFQPDMTWIKARSGTHGTENHNLYDSVRGATKFLIPNGTTASTTDTKSLTAFDSDGFSLGTRTDVNGSAEYVAWNWLASNTTASNTDGSITSTVSANTTAGFSIVSYTGNGTAGATIGHGLGATPAMFLIKRRDVADGWIVYHHKNTSAPETDHLRLDSTSATSDDNTKFNDTAPTSSVFSLGSDTSVNGSSSTFIAYCFAEKKGYSKFGSYTGNNSADGTFIYTGFSPAFVLVRNTSAVAHWMIQDNRRSDANGDNPANKRILPSSNVAEATDSPIDLLSNGFKIRSTGSYTNDSGNVYIYMAFAEQPLVGTNNIPCTAR